MKAWRVARERCRGHEPAANRDWHLATLSCCGTGRSLADWPLPSAPTTSLTSVSTQLRRYSPTNSQFYDVHSHPLVFAGCTVVQSNSDV